MSSVVLGLDDLWVPDVLVYGLTDLKNPGIEAVTVSADGKARWLSQRIVTVPCVFNLNACPQSITAYSQGQCTNFLPPGPA